MPIRFRCAYCNQLMGISRRKAGTVVRCPTCSGQVVVPNPDAPEPAADPQQQPAPPVFERSDFDEVFQHAPAVTVPGPAPAPPPPVPWGTHAEASPDVERIDSDVPSPLSTSGRRQAALVLSPQYVTWIAVAGVALLAIAFVAGVFVGKLMFAS